MRYERRDGRLGESSLRYRYSLLCLALFLSPLSPLSLDNRFRLVYQLQRGYIRPMVLPRLGLSLLVAALAIPFTKALVVITPDNETVWE